MIAAGDQLQNTREAKIFICSVAHFIFAINKVLLTGSKNGIQTALIVEADPRYLSTPSAVKWMRARTKSDWLGIGEPLLGEGGGESRFINQFDAMLTYSQREPTNMPRLVSARENICGA